MVLHGAAFAYSGYVIVNGLFSIIASLIQAVFISYPRNFVFPFIELGFDGTYK